MAAQLVPDFLCCCEQWYSETVKLLCRLQIMGSDRVHGNQYFTIVSDLV